MVKLSHPSVIDYPLILNPNKLIASSPTMQTMYTSLYYQIYSKDIIMSLNTMTYDPGIAYRFSLPKTVPHTTQPVLKSYLYIHANLYTPLDHYHSLTVA